MEIFTKRHQLSNCITLTVKGDNLTYSTDFYSKEERMQMTISLLDAAAEIIYNDSRDDEELNKIRNIVLDVYNELHTLIKK